MILDRAINGPRASMETRTLSQEELGRFLKNLFLTGEDVEPGLLVDDSTSTFFMKRSE